MFIFQDLQGDERNGTICPLIGQIDSAFDQSDLHVKTGLKFVLVTAVCSCNFSVAHTYRKFVYPSLRLCETSLLKKILHKFLSHIHKIFLQLQKLFTHVQIISVCTKLFHTCTKYFYSCGTLLHIHKPFHKLKIFMTII